MEIPALSLPSLGGFNMSFFFNTFALTAVLVVFFILYVVLSGVLIYHWRAYGMKSQAIVVTESLFIFVSAILFVVASLAIYYF